MFSAETSGVFVGRTSELADLERWFKDEAGRLLTLLGPPGVGKTSLLRRWRAAYAPQVIWVELLPLTQASQCLGAISEALGVQLQGLATQEQHIKQLGAILEARGPLVLALDNMEHLIEASALLARLLEQVKTLRVIVTSRQALALELEQRYELKPLSAQDAKALYLARKTRALTDEDERSLDGLLLRLDGLPLALELAAAQRDFFTVLELSRTLDGALGVLEDDGGPEHHRSLELALRASWQLLKPPERELLSALSLWPGAFTLEHAQAISGLEDAALWRGLKALRKHSMISRDAERMHLLWSVRQFVLHAAEPELLIQARERLHQWLERRGRALFERFGTPAADEACEQIRALMPVFFAELSVDALAPPAQLLVVVLLGVMFERGYLSSSQIEPLYARALDAAGRDPRYEVQMLFQRAAHAHRGGDEPRAYALLAQAEAIAREHGLERQLGHAYRLRGFFKVLNRQHAEATALFDQALAIAESTQDHDLLGITMFYKAWCLNNEGQYVEALRLSRQSVLVLQEYGAPSRAATARIELGVLLAKRSLWQEACEQLKLAKEVLGSSTFVISMGTLEGAWAQYYVARGELEAAHEASLRAIEVFRQCGYPRMVVTWQIYRVGLFVQQGRWDEAIAQLMRMLSTGHYTLAQLNQESLHALLALSLWAAGEREQALGYMKLLRLNAGACGVLIQHLLADLARALELEPWPSPPICMDDEYAQAALKAWRATGETRAHQLEALEESLRCVVDKVSERVVLGLLRTGVELSRLDPEEAPLKVRAPLLRWSGEEILEVELEGAHVVSLKRRAPMRRILSALVRLAQQDANAELSVWEVFEAGWPGERVDPDVASHRVYVTMNRLRGLGLEDYVLTTGDGYRWVIHGAP